MKIKTPALALIPLASFTPSFEYRLNSGDSWHSIGSGYLSAGATTNKAVLQSGYTAYTSYWDAQSQIPNTYSSTAQVRVTANDNEVIYNIAYATTTAFALDTKAPVVSTAHINGSSSTSTISVQATDNSAMLDYNLTNNADGSADGVNSGSGTRVATTTSAFNLNTNWTLNGTSTVSSAYINLRDSFGNTATTSIFAPITPANFDLNDISDAAANNYKLIISWTPYTNVAGATFSKYEVWRSTDNVNFALYATVTDPAVNYYLDMSVASTTRYYYQARTVDTDGDSSAFSVVAAAQPIGAGASSLPPVISSVVVDNVKNTSARVTWTTNSLSNSLVTYGLTTGYGSTASSASYITSHTVYLTGLQSNTTYHLKVRSTDFFANAANDDNGGASYTFTTNGGPVITGVTTNAVADNTATVFWNTDRSADSHVVYSTHADLSSPTTVGTATLVATTTASGVYSHQVGVTGLSASTNYYFYVTSTDGSSNTTVDNNNGQYYSILTTRDTTPPVISNISEPVVSATAAVVVWQTDKLSTSQVEWGTTASTSDGSYGNLTSLDTTPSIYHVMPLSPLTPKTPYYFRVISTDIAGNRAVSDENTFTSPALDQVIIIIDNTKRNNNTGDGTVTPSPTGPTISSTTVDPINTFDATIKVVGMPDFRAGIKYGVISSTTPAAPYDQSASDFDLSTTKSIKLSDLKPATTYHFIVSAVDAQGNLTQGKEQTFTTKFLSEDLGNLKALSNSDIQSRLQDAIQSALPSINPPFMTTPVVSDISEGSSTISWNTNIKAYATLSYASDEDFKANGGVYTSVLSESDPATTTVAHSIMLSGLKSDTKYHYSTGAYVFPQVAGKSADYTFTTKAGPLQPQILDVKPDSFRVLWATDSLSSSIVDFRDTTTGTTQTLRSDTPSKQHDLSAANLASGHTYQVRAYGYDADGNLLSTAGTIPVTTSVDKTPPQVTSLRLDSNLVPGRTDIVQSIVSWKTDKPATSAVYYEEGSGSADQPLKNKVENDTGFVQDHVVLLPSLKPATIYRVQVSSTDQAGNTETLPVRTIVTPQQSESIIDIIFKNFSSTFNFIH